MITSSSTYQSIQTALGAKDSPIKDQNYEVYLQGSYKNDTNIRGDSDVDVVVQLDATFGYDLSQLNYDGKAAFQRAYPSNATYLWSGFRADVLRALRSYYGSSTVAEGSKSLKLKGGAGRLSADVVPAIHFQKYSSFSGIYNESHVDGIQFWNRNDGRAIVNFPKPHYANGVAKNSEDRTNGWYKPTVRMFKNARTYLVNQGTIPDDLAPSYFLEGLVYNAPDIKFGGSFEDSFVEVFNWAWTEASRDTLVCQNGELLLFGPAAEQWDSTKAVELLAALKKLWENW